MSLVVTGRVFKNRIRRGWWVDYKDPHTGRRIRKPAADTKAEAEAVLAKIRTDYREKGVFEPKQEVQMALEAFVPVYMDWAKVHKRSWPSDVRFLRRFAADFRGKLLSEITPEMVERYKTRRLQEPRHHSTKPVSPRQVNYELAILKAFFNKAIRWGKATANPVTRVDFLKVNDGRTRWLGREEVEALLKACEASPGDLKAVVTVALNTGMRRGEILALRWSHVDEANGVLRIETSKNGQGRLVPMNDAVREAVRSCLRPGQAVEGTDNYVFRNQLGKPYRDLREAFERALRRAGIKACRFHDLRHTCASHLVSNGVDILVVKELLGHKTLAMTQRYAHLSPERGRSAVGLLAGLFGTNKAPNSPQKGTHVAPAAPPEANSSSDPR